ncbi:MAG: hypothetical protein CL910_06270 [Deltaproteobacteria bacterium]|nr:hypothetical protein [Deltaproteobacteria bacterium]
MTAPSLDDQLQEMVAQATPAPGTPARDPVNPPMIRHWCDAIGDANPVYTDPAAAEASCFGGIVAPPTMLQAWSMLGLANRGPGSKTEPPRAGGGPTQLLNEAGYTSVVATDCEQEYLRYLRPGDLLTGETELESISGEKSTGLGDGYFLTTRTTYRDQEGEVVGIMRFRILWFKPRQKGG